MGVVQNYANNSHTCFCRKHKYRIFFHQHILCTNFFLFLRPFYWLCFLFVCVFFRLFTLCDTIDYEILAKFDIGALFFVICENIIHKFEHEYGYFTMKSQIQPNEKRPKSAPNFHSIRVAFVCLFFPLTTQCLFSFHADLVYSRFESTLWYFSFPFSLSHSASNPMATLNINCNKSEHFYFCCCCIFFALVPKVNLHWWFIDAQCKIDWKMNNKHFTMQNH